MQTVYADNNIPNDSDADLLIPYSSSPPEINISTADNESLQLGKLIYKSFDTPNGKQLAVVFKVNASPIEVWNTVKSYSNYPTWVKNVKEAEIYKQEDEEIYVRFILKHWYLGKYQYYVKHHFSKANQNWATWELDDEYESDFSSSIGFWRVYPVNNESSQSYVTYSADILFKNKKSEFVRARAIKSSLKQASRWVKKQSEK